MSAQTKILILGGVRSGKSRLAETLATQSDLKVTYIATAKAMDSAMQARIEAHQVRRPAHWKLIELNETLAQTLQTHAAPDHCLLVDCLTLWLTQLLCVAEGKHLRFEIDSLLETLPQLPGRIILVSNEVGLGIVPLGELTRRFCDESGPLHQALAQQCDRVILTLAGLPQMLKGEPI